VNQRGFWPRRRHSAACLSVVPSVANLGLLHQCQVATETATTLDGQTKQMEGVLNSLDEIHFSLKKANQVIRDITRRIATDKCATAAWLIHVACRSASC